tara:strand:- start:57078 stop:57536 length:459 start_codon:yes stop_codon:yes gene_type:complete
MKEIKLNFNEKIAAILTTLSGNIIHLIVWINIMIILPILYYSHDKDEILIQELTIVSTHYEYDDDGETQYKFNTIDLEVDDIDYRYETINVSEKIYNEWCGKDIYVSEIDTPTQDNFLLYLFISCFVMIITEIGFLSSISEGKNKYLEFENK